MDYAFAYFKGYLEHESQYPMLASDYPYTSGTSDDSTDCLYSASKAIEVQV